MKHFAAPSTTKELPEDYVQRVKQVHESGGYGSRGYELLNTHINFYCILILITL